MPDLIIHIGWKTDLRKINFFSCVHKGYYRPGFLPLSIIPRFTENLFCVWLTCSSHPGRVATMFQEPMCWICNSIYSNAVEGCVGNSSVSPRRLLRQQSLSEFSWKTVACLPPNPALMQARPPPKWAPICAFLWRRLRLLRTRFMLVSGNLLQSQALPTHHGIFLVCLAGQPRGTKGMENLSW